MKTSSRLKSVTPLAVALLGLLTASQPALLGASQTWTNSASTLAWNGTDLNWTGAAWTNNNDALFAGTGAGVITADSTVAVNDLTFSATGYTVAGALKLGNDAGSLVTADSAVTISAVIANGSGGASALTKAGTATLSLNGANTFSGGLTINAGTLSVGTNSVYSSGAIASGGAGTGNVVLSAGSTLNLAVVNGLILTNNLAVNGTATLNKNGRNATFGLGGTNATLLTNRTTLTGAGNLTLSDSSTNTGSWTVKNVDFSNFTGTFTYALTATANRNNVYAMDVSGTLDLSQATFTSSGEGTAAVWRLFSNGITTPVAPTSQLMKIGELSGLAPLSADPGVTATYEIGHKNTDSTFAGTFITSGTTTLGLVAIRKVGSGTLTLTGVNAHTAGTAINGGVLVADNASALGTAGAITFGGGTLRYTANNTTDYSARIATGTSTGPVSIDTNGQNVAFATALTGSQSGGLTKLGAGTLTLSGANAYTGSTTVTAGTLALADNATIKFVIGAAGVGTSLTGSGSVTLDGDFVFDLAGASTTLGDTWPVVNVGTLAETYGSTFSVKDFTENNGVWTRGANGTYYEFSKLTGLLKVVNAPSGFVYQPPVVSIARHNDSYLVGSNVVLEAVVTGIGPFTYQWFKGAAPVSGATSATLTLTAAQSSASGTYSVQVVDHAAESVGQTATSATSSGSAIAVLSVADATVAYYRFEDGTNAAALTSGVDSSASGNTLSATGALTYSSITPYNKIPQTLANNTLALSLPGSGSNSLAASTTGALAGTNLTDFTIETFVRFNSLVGTQTFVGRDDTGNPGEGPGGNSLFYFQKNPSHQFRAIVVDKANNTFDLIDNQAGFTVAAVGNWYHVAVVGDIGAGTLKLYVNGVLRRTATGYTGLFVPSASSATPWTLGRGQFNGVAGDYTRGYLDEVRFARLALTPNQFLNSTGTTTLNYPTITSAPSNYTVRPGQNVTFTVAATGTGGLNYQWYKNDVLLSGQTSSSLALTAVDATSEGTYAVKVSDAAGTPLGIDVSTTVSASLRVLDVPLANRAIGLNFVGAAASTTASTAIGSIAGAESAGFLPTANWNNSATENGVANQATPQTVTENTGAASLTTATWAAANTWATLNDVGAPASKSPDFRLHHGYIETRATTGATVSISGIPYGTYDVYVYVMGGGVNNVGSAFIDREGSPTYYYRTVYNDGYVTPAFVPFMVGDAASAAAAQTAARATFVRFASVTGGDLTISVKDAVTNANAGGIAAIQIVDRTPAGTPYPPTVTAKPVSRLISGGSGATFSVTAASNNAGGVLSYQWQRDGVNISGQTGSTLNLGTGLTSANSGNYSVVVTDNSSLGSTSVTVGASLVVVDLARSVLINGDINAVGTPTFVGDGILRTTGSSAANIGSGTTVWNGILGAAGTATRGVGKESTGYSLSNVTFTYGGAEGVEDNTALGYILGTPAVALSRDYLYTDNQTVPLTASIGGLDALAGHKVTLVVYAYGKLSTAFSESAESDTATVTLASANNHLGSAPAATSTTGFDGRDITYNNLEVTGGVSAAYVTFTGVVAPNGTVSWSLGSDSDLGRIPLVGFQLLITGEKLAPEAPTALNAVAGNNQVALSWTASAGADTYTVKRATTPTGAYTTISAGIVTGTSYTDSTAVNGTTYYYVVAAAKTSPTLLSTDSNQVSATPVASSSLVQTWRTGYFPGSTATTGPGANTADPDGDGIPNLMEYALGTNPTVSSASPVAVARSGNALTLAFTPIMDAQLTYAIEATNDLASWGAPVFTYPTFTNTNPVTYTDSANLTTTPRRFLRLRVTISE